LKNASDAAFKRELILKITQSAYRHSPSPQWFVETLKSVFLIGGNLVEERVQQKFCKLLVHTVVEEGSTSLSVYALNTFYSCLQLPNCSEELIQLTAWLIGEFIQLARSLSIPNLIVEFSTLLESPQFCKLNREL
jgi:hypothetical protein